jgi:hypothetical protein
MMATLQGNIALFEEPGCNDRNVYHVTKLRMKFRMCQESVKESLGFRVWTKAKWFFRRLFGSAPGLVTVVLSSLVEKSVVGGELMLHFPVLWSCLIYSNPRNYLVF